VGFEFACANVVPGCEGKVEGDTREAVLAKAAEHADHAHGLAPLDEATVEKVKAAIISTG
jgi:predicted small metal-binding protein